MITVPIPACFVPTDPEERARFVEHANIAFMAAQHRVWHPEPFTVAEGGDHDE